MESVIDNEEMIDAGYVVRDYGNGDETELTKKVKEIQKYEARRLR